jgi:hypothetical protein
LFFPEGCALIYYRLPLEGPDLTIIFFGAHVREAQNW